MDNHLIQANAITGDLEPPTINAELMCFYADWLMQNNINTYDSLYQYMSAVRTYCRNNELPEPTTSEDGSPNQQYYGCMRGIKRMLKTDSVKRTPITVKMLRLISEAAMSNLIPEIDHHLGLNVAAAASFMFFLMLRVGEATTKTRSFDITKHAARGDLDIIYNSDNTISHINFTIKVSKTFQFRRGFVVTLYPTNTPTCPVTLITRLLREQPRPK
ncbi:MAG: hypothetical protein COB29_01190, partial [Sulfitobacter sp.]